MGKIEDLVITCGDKKNPVYRPGDTIFGKVTFRVIGEMTVKAVRLYCYGRALTKWAVSGQRLNQSDHRAKEDYFTKQYTFFGGDGEKKLTEGSYSYTYKFELPRENLPSSFEGEYGAIRYWFEFRVHKPLLAIDYYKYKPFSVLGNLDVNEYKRVVSRKDSKTISKALGIGNAGELTLTASLDRAAYCPGEKMLIDMEANNGSTKDLGPIRLRIVQRAWYTVGTEEETNTSVIKCTVTPNKLLKQDKIVWKKHAVEVPAIPPTTIERSCHIIDVYYFVEIEVEVPLGFDLAVKLPVKIGTIPFGAKKIESKNRQHEDCKSYTRIGFSMPLTYQRCEKGIRLCSKTDSDLPFPDITHTPSIAFLTKSPQTTAAKPKTTASAKPNTSTTQPSTSKVQPNATDSKHKPANSNPRPDNTVPKTTHSEKSLPLPDLTAPRSTPSAPPTPLHPTAYPQGAINPYPEGAIAMPFAYEAPPAYDSIYNATYSQHQNTHALYNQNPNAFNPHNQNNPAQFPNNPYNPVLTPHKQNAGVPHAYLQNPPPSSPHDQNTHTPSPNTHNTPVPTNPSDRKGSSGSPQKMVAQPTSKKPQPAASATKTPNKVAASNVWRGAIVGIIFSETHLEQMKDFVNRQSKILDENHGKVLTPLPKFQMSKSEQTSAIYVIFKSQDNASQWAEHLKASHPLHNEMSTSFKVFTAVNMSPSATELKNYGLFPHVNAVMTYIDPTKPLSKEQAQPRADLTKRVIHASREQYGGKSVFVSSKLKPICGDWETGLSYPLENTSLSISAWPNKELFQAYVEEIKSHQDYQKFVDIRNINTTAIVVSGKPATQDKE